MAGGRTPTPSSSNVIQYSPLQHLEMHKTLGILPGAKEMLDHFIFNSRGILLDKILESLNVINM